MISTKSIQFVIKRNGIKEPFNSEKISNAARKAFRETGQEMSEKFLDGFFIELNNLDISEITVEDIQDRLEMYLMRIAPDVAKKFIIYRYEHKSVRDFAQKKIDFINRYKTASNTANTTIDDNANVSCKNIGVINAEIHKNENIQISRAMITQKLRELYPNFDAKLYIRDLEDHLIYKHDESGFAGAIAPYCCAISMYPFILDGIKKLGGLSAAPKNLDSYCGMYINMVFAIASMFAGACATPEFLLFFDWFARKRWGDDYWMHPETLTTTNIISGDKTIRKQIHQYFQWVVYSINQPAASRGLQSAFVNFSYFDKGFFMGLFEDFKFPDGTSPIWESLNWLQHEFMIWFNEERLRTMLTFPVESFALIYRDGEFTDKENAKFVAEEYARGHSFFTYISNTADSLSSCCRLKNKLRVHEFSFTNGNIGIQTGSKSVISLNLSRIMQKALRMHQNENTNKLWTKYGFFTEELERILERVYMYQNAYNELLWDVYSAGLLPVYTAGFISLNKQYLTIGINGLNEAAEFLGIQCNDNPEYMRFCQQTFGLIKFQNEMHRTEKTIFNTEQVPAESLAIKNYNWDKHDGYWVPENRNLYASYIFVPSDPDVSVLEKLRLHGKNYIGEYLDGGSACHINLADHLSVSQYEKLLEYAACVGCQYFTFNIPNSECEDCGYITKHPIKKCPRCGSEKISLWDRVIGYLTKIKNWSDGRQKEQKTRVYADKVC